MARKKRIVTLSVASRGEISGRTRQALSGEQQGAFLSFTSVDLLWKTITPKRLGILRVLAGEETLSIREVAPVGVGRDVKAVHGDVRALIDAGMVEETPTGVRFGYNAVHVDFTLDAA
jgi:predicted transcriptional regulator